MNDEMQPYNEENTPEPTGTKSSRYAGVIVTTVVLVILAAGIGLVAGHLAWPRTVTPPAVAGTSHNANNTVVAPFYPGPVESAESAESGPGYDLPAKGDEDLRPGGCLDGDYSAADTIEVGVPTHLYAAILEKKGKRDGGVWFSTSAGLVVTSPQLAAELSVGTQYDLTAVGDVYGNTYVVRVAPLPKDGMVLPCGTPAERQGTPPPVPPKTTVAKPSLIPPTSRSEGSPTTKHVVPSTPAPTSKVPPSALPNS